MCVANDDIVSQETEPWRFDSAQGDSAHLDSARLDSAHLNSAQMATKVYFHRRSRQNRATRDFGLADLSRCALQQISGPAGPLFAAVIILLHSVVFFKNLTDLIRIISA